MRIGNSMTRVMKCIADYGTAFFRWLSLGLIVGAVSGAIGSLFAISINYVTDMREEHGWLILLLPLGGLAVTAIYKLCRVTGMGTNDVFVSVCTEKKVSYLLAPAVFIGSVITHLFGGSAGREGAALQLGGSVASLLGSILRLNEKTRHIITMCGMGAFFSALFGTPVGACVFALEVVSVGHFCSAAFFPALVSCVSAFGVSSLLGVHPERFLLVDVPGLNFNITWRVAVIAVAGAFVSILFCNIMQLSERLFKRFIGNDYLRVFVGGVIIIVLTWIVGNQDYNGGGIGVIDRIFKDGSVRYEAFLLKIIFTAVTMSVGFKGGEIVPTFFIGATMGGSLAVLLGLNPALGAAVGMAALFSGVTNCPLATIVLCVELFSGQGFIYCALASVTSFLLSGHVSLYTKQRQIYSKLTEDIIDTCVE